jgi:hypothetical protein
MERKGIYTYANKISIVGRDTPKLTPLDDDVRPQFHVANADELGTYQAQSGVMSLAPRQYGASISQQFALIPPINGVGFPAHFVNKHFRTVRFCASFLWRWVRGIGEKLGA